MPQHRGSIYNWTKLETSFFPEKTPQDHQSVEAILYNVPNCKELQYWKSRRALSVWPQFAHRNHLPKNAVQGKVVSNANNRTYYGEEKSE